MAVIRGWDNGRGIDSGRGLLSAQGNAIRNITGEIFNLAYQDLVVTENGDGAFYRDLEVINTVFAPSNYITKSKGDSIKFDASRVVPTAPENRPRNVAFQYICLAA